MCVGKPCVFTDSSLTGKLWLERLLECSIESTFSDLARLCRFDAEVDVIEARYSQDREP